MAELLNCPFCGGAASFEEVHGALPASSAWSVGCGDIECIGFQSVARFPRKAEAAKSWNTRSALPQGSAPEGMVLVPREPTEAMLRAAWPVYHPWSKPPAPEERPEGFADCKKTATNFYKAMIAATPSDPVVKVPVIGKSEG